MKLIYLHIEDLIDHEQIFYKTKNIYRGELKGARNKQGTVMRKWLSGIFVPYKSLYLVHILAKVRLKLLCSAKISNEFSFVNQK